MARECPFPLAQGDRAPHPMGDITTGSQDYRYQHPNGHGNFHGRGSADVPTGGQNYRNQHPDGHGNLHDRGSADSRAIRTTTRGTQC